MRSAAGIALTSHQIDWGVIYGNGFSNYFVPLLHCLGNNGWMVVRYYWFCVLSFVELCSVVSNYVVSILFRIWWMNFGWDFADGIGLGQRHWIGLRLNIKLAIGRAMQLDFCLRHVD